MKDIYASITERFIEKLKQGTVPWQKKWVSAQNIVSKKSYRGINALLLGMSPYESPFWLTFKQAQDLGGTIRKGEKSTPIIYYKMFDKRDGQGNVVFNQNGSPAQVPFIRWSNVFNLSQTEGIEAPALALRQEKPALDRAKELVEQANLCRIDHSGFAAVYDPKVDRIQMPKPGFFRTEEDYYHTLFHEMTHATGHGSRLDREGITQPVKFGSERYSKEELIAELGAAFLSNEVGTLDKVRFENSAAYLASWAKKLSEDASLIVSTASQAQKGVDWVIGIREVERIETNLVNRPVEVAQEYGQRLKI